MSFLQTISIDEYQFLIQTKLWWCVAYDLDDKNVLTSVFTNGLDMQVVEIVDGSTKTDADMFTRFTSFVIENSINLVLKNKIKSSTVNGVKYTNVKNDTQPTFYRLPIENIRNVATWSNSRHEQANIRMMHALEHIKQKEKLKAQFEMRERLYLYICMVCLLERRRLYNMKKHSHISFTVTDKKKRALFTVNTKSNAQYFYDTTKYINHITIVNGPEFVLKSVFRMETSVLTSVDESRLYKEIRRVCTPDLERIGQRALSYKYSIMQSISNESGSHPHYMKELLVNELAMTRAMVVHILEEYICMLQYFLKGCHTLTTFNNKVIDSTIGYTIRLVHTTLFATNAMLEIVQVGKGHVPGPNMKHCLEHVQMLKKGSRYYADVSPIANDTDVAWLLSYDMSFTKYKSMNYTDMYSETNTILSNCFRIIQQVQTFLEGSYQVWPNGNTFHDYKKLTGKYIPRLFALQNMSPDSKDIGKTLAECAKVDRKHSVDIIIKNPITLQYLLMGNQNVVNKTVVVSQSPDDAYYNDQAFKKTLDGIDNIANACLCGRSIVTFDGVVHENGISDDVIADICNGLSGKKHFESTEKFESIMTPLKLVSCPLEPMNKIPPHILRIEKYQNAYWDAENALVEHAKSYKSSSTMKRIQTLLSKDIVYNAIFARMDALYDSLFEYIKLLGIAAQNIDNIETTGKQVDLFSEVPYGASEYLEPESSDDDFDPDREIDTVLVSENKKLFNKKIAPLMSMSPELVGSLQKLRSAIIKDVFQMEKVPTHLYSLYAMIHDIRIYFQVNKALVGRMISERLVQSVMGNKKMVTFCAESKSKNAKLQAKNKAIVADALVAKIETSSSASFIKDTDSYFDQALDNYYATTNKTTVITDIYKFGIKAKSRSEKLTLKLFDRVNDARDALNAL